MQGVEEFNADNADIICYIAKRESLYNIIENPIAKQASGDLRERGRPLSTVGLMLWLGDAGLRARIRRKRR